MKKIAVGVVFAAAILMGLAVAQAMTVSEACGTCVMPDGMEQYSAYEVLVETYDVIIYSLPELAPPLAALTRRLVARPFGFSTTVLIDQIVVDARSRYVSGPVIDVIVIDEGGVVLRYEWRLQEIVEFLHLVQYGENRRW